MLTPHQRAPQAIMLDTHRRNLITVAHRGRFGSFMDLRSYLEKRGISHRDFAARIGVNQSTVTRLCAVDPPWPSRDLVEAIARETNGKVTADAFYTKPHRGKERA
jgi:lambda repressor-like predicted transcriptional regulator